MKNLRKTKIVGTIGPASENRLEELFEAGLKTYVELTILTEVGKNNQKKQKQY